MWITVRTAISSLVFALLFVVPRPAVAQTTVIIGNGTIAPEWDGSLTGFHLTGDGTLLQADYLGGSPTSGLRAGEVADLSTTITTVSQHTFFERVNGVEYNSVWVRAELRLMATPFTAPAPPDEASFNDLSTPFTMQGEFAAFTDQAMTNQVFAVSVQGNGVAEFVWNQFQDNTYLASGAGGAVYRFVFPVEFPFSFASVGEVGLSGNSGTAEDGALYMGASGGDIWNTADAFGFTWRTVQGDGEIVARITGQSNTNPFAKAGLMIRESAFDPSSAGVLIDVKPNHELELMTRAASGAPTSYLGGALVQSDSVWLKLTRTGDVVTGFVSIDGTTWIAGGSAPFTGPSAAFGFAVTSHDNTKLNQAVFKDWSVTDIPDSAGPLDRSDWTVVATEQSPWDPPEHAIDGNLDTRFSTGNSQHDNQGFIVSWPGDRTIGRIQMEIGPSTGDYPRACGIWVKDTAGSVTFVACAADVNGNVDVTFSPLAASIIEVWQWGTANSWWSIAEFNVFEH